MVKTLLELARRGVVSEEFKVIASAEEVSVEHLAQRIAKGSVVVVGATGKRAVKPLGIGEGLRTKVNVNVGTSVDFNKPEVEVEKARLAVKYGADTVMDLSTAGDLDAIRRMVLKAVEVPVGTVPIYQAAIESVNRKGAIVHMSVDDVFNAIERHARDGVDFMTIHAGVTKEAVLHLKEYPRLTGIVSRGGAFLAAWILHNDKENPLYENYDYLLELTREYDFAISLGDGLRPGSLRDAGDWAQVHELLTIGDLVERARKAGVQVIVEGPGHMPLDQIAPHVKLMKTAAKNAPLYTLGPLVTDVAPGYDHVTLAIGGAIAAAAGVDYLCAVYKSEHLGIPLPEDVRESVIATRIAAHAADIAKMGEKALRWDHEISKARASLDWEHQLKLSMDPEEAARIHKRVPAKSGSCSICGDFCVFLILSKHFKGKVD